MVNKNEFKIITDLYNNACGKAHYKIDQTIAEAKEKHGWENGSALTDILRQHYHKATKDIEPLRYEDEEGYTWFVEDENGHLVYDKKDALKMLKAIDHINTYIL